MKAAEIRKQFFRFFESKDHAIVTSAPMVIKDDPTLMFTNAGMNQFKPYFLGHQKPKSSRIANTQKCLRVSGKHNDLEEVGIDTYHHTFFEMLGNWSFGDYFKKEAISWAWELLTEVYKINPVNLYVTIFEGDSYEKLEKDHEAYDFWKEIVPEEKILLGNKKDNFWEMGEQGPCGPCSEIHIDLRSTEEKSMIPGSNLVNRDHPQVIEVWNLVFVEFNRKANGSLEQLPKKHVDTGMGFERLCMAMQGKTSNYDTDVFTPLIKEIETLTGFKYGIDEKTDRAIRVISDHLRSVCFAIVDGQLPSNTGAGYVIRRILRRAIRYGYQFLDFREPFIYLLVPKLANNFSEVFNELKKNQDFISKIIQEEETSFFRTLSGGIKRMEDIVNNQSKIKNQKISGKLAFELYDRYGFPLDLTQLIASENNLGIDIEEFNKSLANQQKRSKIDAVKDYGDWITIKEDDVQEFIGYDHIEAQVHITKYRNIVIKGKEAFQLIFNLTPFYPEGGGQVGDTGHIENNIEKLSIIDTKKENGVIVHFVDRLPNNLNASFKAKVNGERRNKISKNHSATHLLHHALRTVLGEHVEQKGSLVNEHYLRFDFSHFSKLSMDELFAVENLVNEQIREANPLIEDRNTPLETAKKRGAMMLFGEKYGDSVRVIQFGNSIELCGGIHVSNSAHIGNFIIKSESSISSGIRRIEAVSSNEADQIIYNKLEAFDKISKILKVQDDLSGAVQELVIKNSELQKELDSFNKEKLKKIKNQLLSNLDKSNSFSLIEHHSDLSADQMKQIAFELKGELSNFILLLTSNLNNKPVITLMISENLVQSKGWNAGSIIRNLSVEIKGGGGGQPFFATAGGSDVDGLKKVIEKAKEIFKD